MPNDLEDRLYRVDRMMRAAGMAPLSREELQRLASQMQAQGVSDPRAMFAEGGLINDASGQGTNRIRSQFGVR